MQEKYTIRGLISFIVVIGIIHFISNSHWKPIMRLKYDSQTFEDKMFELKLRGIIISKYNDSTIHRQPLKFNILNYDKRVIILEGFGERYPGLDLNIDIGDSLIKEKKSLVFILIKMDGEKMIFENEF